MKKKPRDLTMTKKMGESSQIWNKVAFVVLLIQLCVKKKRVSIAFTYIFVTKYPICF